MKSNHVVYFGIHLTLLCAIPLLPQSSFADSFSQVNLVSDVPGLAKTTDANLKNPWGVAFSATSPFWVSNQGSGTSTLYDGAGTAQSLVVTIPGGAPPSGPTGQVFNGTSGFALNGAPTRFIFDTLNGTIDGWGSGTTAIQAVSTPGAIYTGLALANSGSSSYLYGADSTGSIRVFDSNFKPTSLAGNFTDPNAISGYVPFNIQLLGSNLYVTYARLTPQGTGLPGGYIDVFNTNGVFQQRLATGGALNAPWGLAVAPATFGGFGSDLLVGNFGDGRILAYNPLTGAYLGTLNGADGQPIVNSYLWALDFRTGGTNANTDALYFTAGINSQLDGLFGEILDVPEPGTYALLLVAVGAGALLRKRNRGTE